MFKTYQTFSQSQLRSSKKAQRNRLLVKKCAIYPNPGYDFYQNPKKTVQKIPYSSRRILCVLLEMKLYRGYKWLCPSQSLLGKKTGYTREWVNKSLAHLEQAGLIFSLYRHFHSSEYRIAKCLFSKRMKRKLWKLLPALMMVASGQFTQSKERISLLSNYIKTNHYNVSNSSHVHARGECCGGFCSKSSKSTPRYTPGVCQLQGEFSVKIPHVINETVQAINEITTIKLTRAGKLTLSRYHAYAIKAAERKLKSLNGSAKDISNPSAYFEGICRKQCELNCFEINNKILEKAYLSGAIKGDEPMLEEDKIFTNEYRNNSGSNRIYITPPVPKYTMLCKERDDFIKQLNQPPPPSAHAIGIDSYFKLIQNRIDALSLKIDAYKE